GLRTYVALANGDGTFQSAIKSSPRTTGNFSDYKSSIGDFNGDGLSDIVWTMGTTTVLRAYIALANNDGTFELAIHNAPRTTGDFSTAQANIGDFNGDGLSDIAWTKQGSFGLRAYTALSSGVGRLNAALTSSPRTSADFDLYRPIVGDYNGDGYSDLVWVVNKSDGVVTETVLSKGDGRFATAVKNTPGNTATNFSGYAAAAGDYNGDGIQDLVWTTQGTFGLKAEAVLSQQSRLDRLLASVTNGLDAKSTLTYQSITTPGVYTAETDAINPILDIQAAYYVVSQAHTDNGIGGENSNSYQYGGLKGHRLGRGYLGFAWRQSTNDQTGITTRTEYRQDFPFVGQISHTEQRAPDNTLLNETDATYGEQTRFNDRVHALHAEQTIKKKYDLDGTLLVTHTTTNSYDDWGNPTNIRIETTDGQAIVVKEAVSQYLNNTDLWQIGQRLRSSVTRTNPQGSLTRTSAYSYTADGLLASEISEPDIPEYRLQSDHQYDGFGNIIQTSVSGQGIETRTSTSQYDAEGRFATQLSNALGHSEHYTHDPAWGGMLTLTGPNGLATTWQYDGFGRETREDRADGTWTTLTRGDCLVTACPEDAPGGSVYFITTESAGDTPTTAYADRLGRVIRTVTIGFDGTPVYQDTQYNARGLVVRKSTPYFKGEASYWAESTHDLLKRPLTLTQPVSNGGTSTTTYLYQGLSTQVTDALGHTKTTRKNAQGEIIRVEEEEGGLITYSYDANGNLLTTDANRVITAITYDALDRKITMDDPSMGQWSYQYNPLGELTGQTSAKGQTTTMAYDKLGRMVERVEAEGTTSWEYDTATKGIGKLAKVTAAIGYLKTYSYDTLGRPSVTTTRADMQTLQTAVEYDSYSRVVKETRPEGLIVENLYNDYGYLKAIRSPRAQIGDYDANHISSTWAQRQPELVQQIN
ncbi:MAG: hypothetical protein GY753_16795, partial [Gammaproteobacteria bacterium]|nr:hypothetical protein [Gammaproteobacteria bacterium]